jgi:hypothetical protein
MNLDRTSRRSLLGTGALLTIEKAIGPTSAAQPVDTEEATLDQKWRHCAWRLRRRRLRRKLYSSHRFADLRFNGIRKP